MKKLITITIAIMMILGLGSAWADDWVPIVPPNSPAARHGHSMVTLPDGRVLMFGGEDAYGNLFDDLHSFEDSGWAPITPANAPPPERRDHQAWVFGEAMYIYGGYGNQGVIDDMWGYDLVTNTWEEVQPGVGTRPAPRTGHTTTPTADGGALILGGTDVNGNHLEDLWKRNPNNTYEQLHGPSRPFNNHSANLVADQLLIVIGDPGNVAVYVISANAWSFISNGPPLIGYNCTSQTVNAAGENIVFVFGGIDDEGNESNVVYEYNVLTGVTTQRGELMPQPTANGASTQMLVVPPGFKQQYNTSAIMFGGLSGGIPNNNTYTFIPISPPDSITVVAPLDSVAADSVLLIWNHAEPWLATHYQAQVASDSGMTVFFADTVVTDTSCILKNLSNNTDYWWRVRGYNAAGWGVYNTPIHFSVNYVASIDENPEPHLKGFHLNSNYPNPFNHETTISFLIPKISKVEISIYNIKGQKIKTLAIENLRRGHHEILWNGKNENEEPVSSGIYFYKMETDNFSEIKKAILLK